MMAPMTTLKWSCPSLLENTSMCMETWMMMASTKVTLMCNLVFWMRSLLVLLVHYDQFFIVYCGCFQVS